MLRGAFVRVPTRLMYAARPHPTSPEPPVAYLTVLLGPFLLWFRGPTGRR